MTAVNEQPSRDADFTAFVVANGVRVRRLADWLCGDPVRGADLAQTALERAYGRWSHIQAGDPMAYVRRILINQHRSWWTRRRKREWLTDAVPDSAATGDLAELHAQRDAVRSALDVLTRRERTVVVLRYYADLSLAQIATELRVPEGTVKSTLSRGLAKLRDRLATPADRSAVSARGLHASMSAGGTPSHHFSRGEL